MESKKENIKVKLEFMNRFENVVAFIGFMSILFLVFSTAGLILHGGNWWRYVLLGLFILSVCGYFDKISTELIERYREELRSINKSDNA